MIRIFFEQNHFSADCVAGPDNAIACISSASQFNILEANKVKRLVVLNKTYRPFSFTSPPNSIALVGPEELDSFSSLSPVELLYISSPK